MGIFDDAGKARGLVDYNRGRDKKRSEIAQLFQAFKKDNPYATVEDYNQYIESIIGPADFFLRGKLPAQEMLQRMEGDNLKRKKRDERVSSMQLAQQNMSLGNDLRDQAERHVLQFDDDKDVVNALMEGVAGPDASPEEREGFRDYIENSVGSLSNMRNNKRSEKEQNLLKQMMDVVKTAPEADLQTVWNDILGQEGDSYKFLEKSQTRMMGQLKDSQTEIQRKTRNAINRERNDLINRVQQNQDLPRQLTPGSEEEKRAMQWIRQQVEFSDIPADERDEVVQSMTDEAQARRGVYLDDLYSSNINKTTENETANMQARFDNQFNNIKLMAIQRGVGKDDVEGAIIEQASNMFLLPQPLAENLIQFVADKKYSDPQSAISEWQQQLPPGTRLIQPHEFGRAARDNAEQMHVSPQNRDSYLSGAKSASEEQVAGAEKQADEFSKFFVNKKKAHLSFEILDHAGKIKRYIDQLENNKSIVAARAGNDLKTEKQWNNGFTDVTTDDIQSSVIGPYTEGIDRVIQSLTILLQQAVTMAESQKQVEDRAKTGAPAETPSQLNPRNDPLLNPDPNQPGA